MSDSANNGRWAAIVTAALSGIGAAIGARLVGDGMDVLTVDLKPSCDGSGVRDADLTIREGNRGGAIPVDRGWTAT